MTHTTCPNCHEPAKDLYYSEVYAVVHCGCLYDGNPDKVASLPTTEIPLKIDGPGIAPAQGSSKERWLARGCLEALALGWDESLNGLAEAAVLGRAHPITRAYVARLQELASHGYGPLDLHSLRLTLERMAR